jgi:hypothetical protein
MQKPSFSVVSFVVVTLAGVATLVRLAGPYIPPPPENRLANSNEAYLRQAGHQPIDWYPYGDTPFKLARQTGKPILLVIGTPWSQTGRFVDMAAFSDQDVANYLARNFVCMRVDGNERPEWLNNLLPLSRLRIGFAIGFQGWVLDPKGRLMDFIGRTGSTTPLDKASILRALIEVRERYEGLQNGTLDVKPGEAQALDKATLYEPASSSAAPVFQYGSLLSSSIDRTHGGFPIRGYQTLYPNAWRFQASVGLTSDLRASLDPVLLSPMVDLLDGGFFRSSRTVDLKQVEFDKTAIQNAEMVLALAVAGQIYADPLYKELGQAGFDYLLRTRLSEGGIPSGRIGDEARNRRSRRSSLATPRLRSALNPEEFVWAQEYLGLRVGQNPLMVPYLTSRFALLNSGGRFQLIREKMRAIPRPSEARLEKRLLYVEGRVAARLIQAARIWGDTERLQKALPLVEDLTVYEDGRDLKPEIAPRQSRKHLLDYLAYSDAMLQYAIATGHAPSMQKGLRTLLRAQRLFKTPTSGVFTLTPIGQSRLGARDIDVPEVVDNGWESASAQVIRLFHAYGRLLDPSEGRPLKQVAFDTVARFSGPLTGGGALVAGYFAAAAEVQDDAYILTVGHDAQKLADRFAPKFPARLVVAAVGDVRPDLQTRESGVYVVEGATVIGPLWPENLPQYLTPRLELGFADPSTPSSAPVR